MRMDSMAEPLIARPFAIIVRQRQIGGGIRLGGILLPKLRCNE
jgi:ribulose 1,5-bisphosphate synthetase/thiazole synthase